MTLALGSIIEGTVTGITKFGAFVDLGEGTTGLVHISEVADAYVKEVTDFINIGDKVKIKVVNINEDGKIGLSIKQAEEKTRQILPVDNSHNFEDKLARFMKDSNERLTELKKHQEGKKGR